MSYKIREGNMRKRRQYFIDKRFQTRFILIFCLLVIMWTVLTSAVLYYFINNKLESEYYSSHLNFTTTGEIIAPIIFKVNFIAVAIISILAFITALLYVRRVENNFAKFKDAAIKITEGDLTITMPKIIMGSTTDDLSENFNAMIASMRQGMVSISNRANVLDDEIKKSGSVLKDASGNDDKIRAAVQDIKKARANLQTELSRFKVCG